MFRSFSMAVKFKSGLTLTEIMMAILVIAIAFIPIIGVMGTSVKATSRDDARIRAMSLCQDKLDTALSLPFGSFVNMGVDIDAGVFPSADNPQLSLDPVTISSVEYSFILKIDDRVGTFTVPMRDFEEGDYDDPATWEFVNVEVGFSNLLHRYRMTVNWKELGDDSRKHSYSLVTFKANLEF